MSETLTTNAIDDRISTDFVTANRQKFEVDQCGDQSSRKLALCLHGFPEHSVSWRYQLPALAALGYKAWAPNLRGYGRSFTPRFYQDYGIEHLMADVGELIDAADCDEVTLVGHDWGAIIAWYFAMREIRPLHRLIICNVPHPATISRIMGRGSGQLRKSWYVFFFQLPWLPEWLLRFSFRRGMGEMIRQSSASPAQYSDEVVRIYSENAARPGGMTGMINYYRALIRGGGVRRQARLGFPVIQVPTLMLWGEDDMALTIESTRGTEDFVRDFTIRYLPRVSHWVQQDAPTEVNAMIKAFLAGEAVPYMRWESRLVHEPPDKAPLA